MKQAVRSTQCDLVLEVCVCVCVRVYACVFLFKNFLGAYTFFFNNEVILR